MDIRTAFPSKYLEASELGGEPQLTIREVAIEEVGQPAKACPVIYFQSVAKGMVLNKTNANSIAELYGYETDRWIGQPIVLYATETSYEGKMKPCIRIRTSVRNQIAQPTLTSLSNGQTNNLGQASPLKNQQPAQPAAAAAVPSQPQVQPAQQQPDQPQPPQQPAVDIASVLRSQQ